MTVHDLMQYYLSYGPPTNSIQLPQRTFITKWSMFVEHLYFSYQCDAQYINESEICSPKWQ